MSTLALFNTYKEALERGDFTTVFSLLSDNITWHMGGNGELSGVVIGRHDLQKRFGEFVDRSNGTFKVVTNWAADNNDFVAASVVSMAERHGNKLHMQGIDLFRIEDNKIVEVWTFAEFQSDEDEFWRER